jgi:hypothetical protein
MAPSAMHLSRHRRHLSVASRTFPPGLRSSVHLLQSQQSQRTAFETQLALEWLEAERPCLAFPLLDANSHAATGDVRELRALGARLTTGAAELLFAHAEDFLQESAEAVPATPLRSRPGQAMGGLVLGAISDDQDGAVTCQSIGGDPVGMPALRPHRLALAPAVLREPPANLPALIATPLPEGFGGIPGVHEDVRVATAQAKAGITEAGERKGVLGGAPWRQRCPPRGRRSVPGVPTNNTREQP